jgi:glutamate synthase (NADPH/NADH) large chain
MEPWDGPAAVAFTDGRQIGATLDRNGLRPARFIVTDDDLVVMASESGVLPIPEEKIVRKWRLQPGKMLLIDLDQKAASSRTRRSRRNRQAEHPYEDWLTHAQYKLKDLDRSSRKAVAAAGRQLDQPARSPAGVRLHAGRHLKLPRTDGANGDDPIGSMGTDTPIAVLSSEAEAALRLFQAELRAGHQPADRSDPRRAGDEPGLDDRPAPEPAGHGAGTHKRLEVTISRS